MKNESVKYITCTQNNHTRNKYVQLHDIHLEIKEFQIIINCLQYDNRYYILLQ